MLYNLLGVLELGARSQWRSSRTHWLPEQPARPLDRARHLAECLCSHCCSKLIKVSIATAAASVYHNLEEPYGAGAAVAVALARVKIPELLALPG